MTPVVVVLIAAGAGVIVLCAVWTTRREKARAEAMRLRAQALGFTFAENAAPDGAGGATLPLFQRGRRHKATNVMTRTDRDVETLLFDYAYTTGSGKHQSTHRQTVALFQFPDGDLPKFEVSPEALMHRIAGLFGYDDIDFDASPEFSKLYLVRGSDEMRVRAVLGPSSRHALERSPGWSVEGASRALAVYRGSKRVNPDELSVFLEEAKQIRQAIGR
jgi:hypothetical protein